MLPAFATLLLCQLAGEAAVRALGLTIPGPVVGMVLLVVLLIAKAPLPALMRETSDGILRHLSLLFVPAGIGLVNNLDRLGADGLKLLVVIVLSTAIALAVTALVFAGIAWLMGDQDGKRSGLRAPKDMGEAS
jgi:holin-like protein